MSSRYLFIVGLPRSGTTLLVRILNTANSVAICPETHYFGKPKTMDYLLKRLISNNTPAYNSSQSGMRKQITKILNSKGGGTTERIVDYLYNAKGPYWSWLRGKVDKDKFLNMVNESKISDKDLLSLILDVYGLDSPIIGEKTPVHLFYVPTILDWYPQAKLIHIMRHPCAIYTSLKYYTRSDRPFIREGVHKKIINRIDILLMLRTTANWNRAVRLHFHYQEYFANNYYPIIFEKLVQKPEKVVKGVCDFINIDFSDHLLNPIGQHNSSLLSHNVKIDGIDRSFASKWKDKISPFEERFITHLSNANLFEMGYLRGDL